MSIVITKPGGGEGGSAASLAFDPTDYGAKGNATVLTDGATTSGSKTLSTAHKFSHSNVGDQVYVEGAGRGGARLITTIASVAGGVATLTDEALATTSSATVTTGTLDTAAINKTIEAANAKYVATGTPQTVLLTHTHLVDPLATTIGSINSTTTTALTGIVIRSGVNLRGGLSGGIIAKPQPMAKTKAAITNLSTTGTVTVDSTAGFPSSGKCKIGGTEFTYTGTTSTTFTGCTSSFTGNIAEGIQMVSRSFESSAISVEGAKATGAETSHWSITDLLIDGMMGGVYEEVENPAIRTGPGKDGKVERCTIKGHLGKCWFIVAETVGQKKRPEDMRFANNYVTDCASNVVGWGNGVKGLDIVDNICVDQSLLLGPSEPAVGVAESFICSSTAGSANTADLRITGNTIHGWGAIDVTGPGCVVSHNKFTAPAYTGNFGPAIRVIEGAHGAQITNNKINFTRIENNENVVVEGGQKAIGVNFSGNTIYRIGNQGLLSSCGEFWTVSENIFTGPVGTLTSEITSGATSLKLQPGTMAEAFPTGGGTIELVYQTNRNAFSESTGALTVTYTGRTGTELTGVSGVTSTFTAGSSVRLATTGSQLDMKLNFCRRAKITGNTVFEQITLAHGGEGVLVANNSFIGAKLVLSEPGTGGATITGNVFEYGFIENTWPETTLVGNRHKAVEKPLRLKGEPCINCLVTGNSYKLTGESKAAVIEESSANSNVIEGNKLTGTTPKITVVGAATRQRRNGVAAAGAGVGTAAIANGSKVTEVTHNLPYTPTAGEIRVTPTNTQGKAYFVTGITSEKFKIELPENATAEQTFSYVIG